MKDLKVNLHIERDGKIEQFNCFAENELDTISERLSRTMSTYFTKHTDELKNLRTNDA